MFGLIFLQSQPVKGSIIVAEIVYSRDRFETEFAEDLKANIFTYSPREIEV